MAEVTASELVAYRQAVTRLHRRIETIHERVPCPTCKAQIGVRCRDQRPGKLFGQAIKNPHRARWIKDGTPFR